MELPIYEFLINEEEEDSGVQAVALVEHPATERDWQAFDKKVPFAFEVQDEEKRIVSGALMVADLPIFRRDMDRGEYFCVFKAPTIEMIRDKFMLEGKGIRVNEDHDPDRFTEGAFMVESFIIDPKRGINVPEGFDGLTPGSWFGLGML
jgi:hypothetical protein